MIQPRDFYWTLGKYKLKMRQSIRYGKNDINDPKYLAYISHSSDRCRCDARVTIEC